MNVVRKLAVVIVALASVSIAHAGTIEFDLDYSLSLAPIEDTSEGQVLGGVAHFFPDEAFIFDVGDTLIFNILFDARLQVFEFEDPPGSTNQYFSFGLQGPNTFNGTWEMSIEALGGRGNIWSGEINQSALGGGIGFGWGGAGIRITDHQGSFTGIRWTTTLTSINEGGPLLINAFTGVQMGADRIRIKSVPEPSTLALLVIGLAGMGLARRRKQPS